MASVFIDHNSEINEEDACDRFVEDIDISRRQQAAKVLGIIEDEIFEVVNEKDERLRCVLAEDFTKEGFVYLGRYVVVEPKKDENVDYEIVSSLDATDIYYLTKRGQWPQAFREPVSNYDDDPYCDHSGSSEDGPNDETVGSKSELVVLHSYYDHSDESGDAGLTYRPSSKSSMHDTDSAYDDFIGKDGWW